jgi:hypothetical protein
MPATFLDLEDDDEDDTIRSRRSCSTRATQAHALPTTSWPSWRNFVAASVRVRLHLASVARRVLGLGYHHTTCASVPRDSGAVMDRTTTMYLSHSTCHSYSFLPWIPFSPFLLLFSSRDVIIARNTRSHGLGEWDHRSRGGSEDSRYLLTSFCFSVGDSRLGPRSQLFYVGVMTPSRAGPAGSACIRWKVPPNRTCAKAAWYCPRRGLTSTPT